MLERVNLLLLSKDKGFSRNLRNEFHGNGISVSATYTTEQAEKLIQQTKPDVLLFDLDSVGTEGFNWISKLRRSDQDIEIVVLSGNPTVEAAVTSFHHGANDFITRPSSPERLLEVINQAAARRGLVSKPVHHLLEVIGRRLRQRRKQLKLTLRQLASRTGHSISMLSQIERAESAASIASLHKVATALGMSMGELFEGL
ncbi:MAG: response regulator [Deltaproteobacteria bacterium]|nr:MAG: response regulator [Deltaproteobacteria bacterium]